MVSNTKGIFKQDLTFPVSLLKSFVDYIRPMDKCMSLVVDDRGKWITSPCSAANAVTVCTKGQLLNR